MVSTATTLGGFEFDNCPTLSLYFSTIQFNRLIELDFLSIFYFFVCVVRCCML